MIRSRSALLPMAAASANTWFSWIILDLWQAHATILAASVLPVLVCALMFWIGVFEWPADDPSSKWGLPVPLRILLMVLILLGLAGWRMLQHENAVSAPGTLFAIPMAVGFPVMGFLMFLRSIRQPSAANRPPDAGTGSDHVSGTGSDHV